MSWRTNQLILSTRNIGRFLGLNNCLARVLYGGGYETLYDIAFREAVRTGDCIWDIGANVGYYTTQFSDLVGGTGRVLAFEPSPINFSKLYSACAGIRNVQLWQCGLGRVDESKSFQQGGDELGATCQIISSGVGGITIEVRSAESLIKTGDACLPAVVKIDVEGFEFEVLHGFGAYLPDPFLRVFGIEVHFSILKKRGMSDAPRWIEKLLLSQGFQVSWPDASHILATRV